MTIALIGGNVSEQMSGYPEQFHSHSLGEIQNLIVFC